MDFDLDRFHAGDEALFAELVAAHSRRIWPQLRRYAQTEAEARDLLQDVWARAYAKRQTFDGRGSFIGWLMTVARTVGLVAAKKRGREPAIAELSDVPDPAASRDGLLLATLRDAVLALPERQRDVVMLRLVEGLSTTETARRLECAEGTVKATLHQATRKLRESLKESKP